jgi:hypothetical protein
VGEGARQRLPDVGERRVVQMAVTVDDHRSDLRDPGQAAEKGPINSGLASHLDLFERPAEST